ncbi:protein DETOXIFICATION 42-like [Zingiber officinale]|uniref:protein DETOXIFICATION 42-like n=1 Tax=Zingiber officinale TaxID=94328 RepID=UPI001C4B4E80|nr:protein DETOXIFICATION 42-like [Zingiber officinale]
MEPVEGPDVESEKSISLEDNVSGQPAPEEAATATVLYVATSTQDQETEEDEEEEEEEEEETLSALGKPRKTGLHIFFLDLRSVFKLDDLGSEILRIAVPAALALAADPLASLVDTAFIGRLGSVEIAAVGVSIAIFNQASKICIYPLISVTTSFVAEEDAIMSKSMEEGKVRDPEKASPGSDTKPPPVADSENAGSSSASHAAASACKRYGKKKKYIPSVTSALIVGGVLGLFQAIFLIFAAKLVLRIMGVKPGSPMLSPALRYLTLRSLGAPAVLLSLAMQGVFRGFKDTKTPLYATVVGDAANIILDPILMFVFHMNVSGAAIAHVISQYLITLILLCRLVQKVDVVPPSINALKFSRFLRCGFLLLARVIAVTFCVTLAASLAARQGPTPMAAFQICLQLWLSTSLLADGLAVAGQAILATSFTKSDHHKVVFATARVLQHSVVLGLALSLVLGVGIRFGSGIFTKDIEVQKLIHKAIPFVAGTQTINSVAFVFDGINFGASDYTFAAYSMVGVAAVSIPSLIYLAPAHGFMGIWIALSIYMAIRMLASTWRMGAARGPWEFLRR